MAKICENKSVGILVRNSQGELLLIERKKYNFGFAPPAGHLDGDTFLDAARKELEEEVGLRGGSYGFLLERDLRNPCRRDGGTHHVWQVYEVNNPEDFEIKPHEDETKSYLWVNASKLKTLAARLEEFMRGNNLTIDDLPGVVAATNNSPDWRANPGLEPPWYLILKAIEII